MKRQCLHEFADLHLSAQKIGMSRDRRVIPDDSSVDGGDEPRRRMRKRKINRITHRKRLGASDLSEDTASLLDDYESAATPRDQTIQTIIYFGQLILLIIHLSVSLYLLGRLPAASGMLLFHGIFGPVTIILYITGLLSFVNGYLSMYRRQPVISRARRAQWFRRYMRVNKYLVLVWILATLSSVFGCWGFNYAQELDVEYPPEKLAKATRFEPIVKQIIIGLPEALKRLEDDYGITPTTPPLDAIGTAGRFYYVTALFITFLPAVLLLVGIHFQRRFYALKFIN